jgi:hypothetical protein
MNKNIHPYFAAHVSWEGTQDPIYPYRAVVDKQVWVIRINDFPEEALYTLFVDDKAAFDFDDWPYTWKR